MKLKLGEREVEFNLALVNGHCSMLTRKAVITLADKILDQYPETEIMFISENSVRRYKTFCRDNSQASEYHSIRRVPKSSVLYVFLSKLYLGKKVHGTVALSMGMYLIA